MRLTNTGVMQVTRGEEVVVEIEAFGTMLLVSMDGPEAGRWSEAESSSTLKRTWAFVVTDRFAERFSYTAGFGFVSYADSPEYKVTISGSGSGDYTSTSTITKPTTGFLATTEVWDYEVAKA